MPINIKNDLPAKDVLEKENIFVMSEKLATKQDIRPLKIAILNLMPLKIATEIHLLRLLSNTPLQVEVELVRMKTHESKNTSKEHILSFYKKFDEIKNQKFDGLIITGAPIEMIKFEDVDYWEEFEDIMKWSRQNVTSTLFICWAAQAGLYYHYNIPKYHLKEKKFGVFNHTRNDKKSPIVRGFDDVFPAPHSRHTEVRREDIEKIKELNIISESADAGIYIVESTDKSKVFITGHSEYDPLTLKEEYERDLAKGINIKIPENYFPNNDPNKNPKVRWRSHANLLFSNWLNYYVYQNSPYVL